MSGEIAVCETQLVLMRDGRKDEINDDSLSAFCSFSIRNGKMDINGAPTSAVDHDGQRA